MSVMCWWKAMKSSREHTRTNKQIHAYMLEVMTDAALQIMEKDRLVNTQKSQKQNRIPTLNHAKNITCD